ncbi:DUF4157 domain-containing protein [Aureisphaera galaxeae]|uniref:eCIS core domain-containing protein n=1 Tax=Aureisphaera galaxeae TaxID=1538023 RepID=UPI0023501415|nr:DUF4157 domain-containing protein [Aureisphaera galaxeae]MDC8005361.1 DUF4157 domain-containing protein [Aureisphaera galaxeae]
MTGGFVQKKEAPTASKTNPRKATPFIGGVTVQRKLAIGSAEDAYEKEADHVADQVVQMKLAPKSIPTTGALVQRKCTACEREEKVQKKPIAASITPMIQRQGGSGEGIASQSLTQQISSNKGSGHKMDHSTLSFMESRFGADFSGVSIHTGSQAIQMSQELNAQAFTVGNDIYFNEGKYNPSSTSGKHLLAHELTHTLQQKATNSAIQRRLFVSPTHHSALNAADPAAGLTRAQRFSMMDTLVQGLCPNFEVDTSTGEVVDKTRTSRLSSEYSSSSSPVGCCCLALITKSTNDWTIAVSELDGPHTRIGSKLIVMSSSRVPIEFGSFTASNTLAFQGEISAFGHELCGHAVLADINAHPPHRDRTTSDVHDPTVRIENLISTEQGVPASELRGLARSGSHRGESVDKITVRNFPSGGTAVASLPSSEQAKIRFAASYIMANSSWVDVIGHTDSSGNATTNDRISRDRANNVKSQLNTLGVPNTITKFRLRGVNRFTRVEGVRDRFPPRPPLNASPGNWRRVEILIAGFPAGAQNPVPRTPTRVAAVPRPRTVGALSRSSDSCVSLLVRGAYAIP